MQALAASCEELRARTGNPPLENKLLREDYNTHLFTTMKYGLNDHDKHWLFEGS
jgi:hypothetical protein